MMTKEQQQTVTAVYRQFVDSDCQDKEWTKIDTYMEQLAWLDDAQLVIESAVMIQIQSSGQPRCTHQHPIENCFVPTIIDAIGYILDLYTKTGNLHKNNRYILEYYLALSQDGAIIY